MLTRKQVEKFQAIYKKYYGKNISYEKAYESGSQLIHLLDLLFEFDFKNNKFRPRVYKK